MISAVVCTYNPRADYLERTLRSIMAQDLDADAWELIVVDNASTSPVSELEFVATNAIRVVSESRPGLTAAKETGSRAELFCWNSPPSPPGRPSTTVRRIRG